MNSRLRVETELGERFGGYLATPSSDTAWDLAASLSRAGEVDLARLLRSFWDEGEHDEPVSFWMSPTDCRVGSQIPDADGPALWFDPLEVGVSVLLPPNPDDPVGERPRMSFRVGLAPLAPWQLIGACSVSSGLPAVRSKLICADAVDVAEVFGKELTAGFIWRRMAEAHGVAAARQVWGTPERQLGDSGSSGLVSVHTFEDALQGRDASYACLVSDHELLREPFRTFVETNRGFVTSAAAIPRERLAVGHGPGAGA